MVTLSLRIVRVHDRSGAAGRPDDLTPAEWAYCLGFEHVGDHVAARLAAKQAVLDRCGDEQRTAPAGPMAAGAISAEHVEILRRPARAPEVRWRGTTGPSPTGDGPDVGDAFRPPGVSMTHAAGYAAALAWTVPGGDSR